MRAKQVFDQRFGYLVAIAVMVVAMIVPSLVAAEQLTERSLLLSNSSASSQGVSYQIDFTADGAADAFVMDFCSNSPVIGQECTAPTGFNAGGADSTTVGFTDVTGSTSKIIVEGAIDASDEVSVLLTGISNPTVAGPMYVRVITYDSAANAALYDSEDLGDGAVDDGGLAVSITPTIGVSGAVLETMTFCVSGTTITASCGATTAPVLSLGEAVGDAVALSADDVSEGSIYTQISTNAASGAVISLKSGALNCGGMKRAGAPTACDILPALNTGIAAGEAKFGVKTTTATNTPSTNASGVLQPVSGSGYNNTTFALNYVSGNATGVTSAFGDPFLNTNGAPANNKNMQLIFGASISNNTPAGVYSADLSMIASGKF